MKPNTFRALSLFFALTSAVIANGQSISINTAGAASETGTILDLSNLNTAGTVGFLPPYVTLTSATALAPVVGTAANLSGLLVYNTSASVASGLSGPGLYYWNNSTTSWIYLGAAPSGSGTANYLARWTSATALGVGVAQDNGTGVGISSAAITPASLFDVDGNVTIGSGATYAGATAAPANGMIVQGQVGIGNNAPNSKAILDLTNTVSHLAFLPPSMTTAQMPVVTAANNGLMVFNTTLDCPEVVVNGSWTSLSGNLHGTVTFAPSSSVQTWIVPNCVVSINVVASGAAGGYDQFFCCGFDTAAGDGATVTATVAVTPLENLSIVVGVQGQYNYQSGGGGGGSFIWDASATTTPLVVAGGGGGVGYGPYPTYFAPYNGSPGSLTTLANNTIKTGANATVKNGGKAGTTGTTSTSANGGGGGGWISNATPAAASCNDGQGGFDLAGGLAGGNGATGSCGFETGGTGGFGGGGGGGADNTDYDGGGGGGGGGYTGGSGGDGIINNNTPSNKDYGGGGGGSCVNGANPTTVVNNISNANGSVTITW